MRSIALAAALLGLCTPALAGPPAPRVDANAWSSLPLGAKVRVEITANCTAHLPAGSSRQLKVLRGDGGEPLHGYWKRDPRFVHYGGQGERLVFHTRMKMPAGRYTIKGLKFGPKAQPRSFGVTIGPGAPPKAPRFAGLKGATCKKASYYEGCYDGEGVHLLAAGKPRPGRRVVWLRERDGDYDRRKSFETMVLAPKLLQRAGGQRIIATVRAVDALDREGGKVCEVEIDRSAGLCGKFPKPGKGKLAGGPNMSGLRKAKCAERAGKGKWKSKIDGKIISFPPPKR